MITNTDSNSIEETALAINDYRKIAPLTRAVFGRAQDVPLDQLETLVSRKTAETVSEIKKERSRISDETYWESNFRLFNQSLLLDDVQLASDILSEAWIGVLHKSIKNNENGKFPLRLRLLLSL